MAQPDTNIGLRKWQEEAFAAMHKRDFRGTVEAATGTGKTMLAIEVIKHLARRYPIDRVLGVVVVPTVQLLNQWAELLRKHTDANVVLVGGGNEPALDNIKQNIIVAVVNSFRRLKAVKYPFIIMDEAHRYASEENLKIIENPDRFGHIMALSATIRRGDGQEGEILKHAPVVYQYTLQQAINDKVVNPYSEEVIYLDLTDAEWAEYNRCDAMFKQWCEYCGGAGQMFAKIKDGDKNSSIAMSWFAKRKGVLAEIDSRIQKAVDLLGEIAGSGERVIVFAETISSIERVADALDVLKSNNPILQYAIYHSQIVASVRKENLLAFNDGQLNILLTAKALDEGYDIADVNYAIIMSQSKSKRQKIQRTGRVLRKSGTMSRIYRLAAADTIEDDRE